MKPYHCGIVLSGGGARGFAHLGVLQALHEYRIEPDVFSGASAGSIVGALIADGNTPYEIIETFGSNSIFKYVDITLPVTGLLKLSVFDKSFKKVMKARTFEELQKKLFVTATNITQAREEVFSSGELIPIIKASSSIPVVFPPVKIDGNEYLDGGIMNNFPLEPLEEVCENIIGVNVIPIGYRNDFNNLRNIAERTFHLTVSRPVFEKSQKCVLFIQPEGLENYNLLDFSEGEKIFELGYEAAVKALDKLPPLTLKKLKVPNPQLS